MEENYAARQYLRAGQILMMTMTTQGPSSLLNPQYERILVDKFKIATLSLF